MGQRIDLTGQRFGKLIVIRETPKRSRQGDVYWECLCDCGKVDIVNGKSLRSGSQKSCGCLHHDNAVFNTPAKTHGGSRTERLYRVWRGMIDRCYYPSHNRYKDYGGRGIYICDEWRNDYATFRNWALDHGYDEMAPRGECTIDRINVDGPYSPENCRFVTMKIQARNKRKRVHFK